MSYHYKIIIIVTRFFGRKTSTARKIKPSITVCTLYMYHVPHYIVSPPHTKVVGEIM